MAVPSLRGKTTNQLEKFLIRRINRYQDTNSENVRKRVLSEIQTITTQMRLDKSSWYEVVNRAGGLPENWNYQHAVSKKPDVNQIMNIIQTICSNIENEILSCQKAELSVTRTHSEKIKAGLAKAREKGILLGGDRPGSGRKKSINYEAMRGIVEDLVENQSSLRKIAENGFFTQKGKKINPNQAKRIVKVLKLR